MFSQTTKIPAKVYRSTDKEAPKLDAVAGSLKTLLKACLVTGYGTDDSRKEPAGWAMPFENDVSAVFRSQSPESTKFCLQCVNDQTTYAVMTPYREMNSLTNGIGNFGYDTAGFNQFAYYGTSATSVSGWILVACDRSFYLILQDGNNKTSQILFFGNARPLAAADNTCAVFFSTAYSTAKTFDTGGFASPKPPMLALAWRGNAPIKGEMSSLYLGNNHPVAYPDPIHGGLLVSEIFVLENKSTRAILPNLLCSQQNLGVAMVQSTIQLDDDDADYLVLNIADSLSSTAYFLLNISYFEYA